jgi:hypothetical protein
MRAGRISVGAVCEGVNELNEWKQSREGWFQSRIPAGFRFGTTPALRATPPDSGGEPRFSKLNSFTPFMTARDALPFARKS